MTVSFIQDPDAFAELVEWAKAQNYDNYAAKPDSVPFRVERILIKDGNMKAFVRKDIPFAQGVLKAHYDLKAKRAKEAQAALPLETM